MRKRKHTYPGAREAEQARYPSAQRDTNEEPDFIGDAPNYDKFKGMKPEEVLVLLNID